MAGLPPISISPFLFLVLNYVSGCLWENDFISSQICYQASLALTPCTPLNICHFLPFIALPPPALLFGSISTISRRKAPLLILHATAAPRTPLSHFSSIHSLKYHCHQLKGRKSWRRSECREISSHSADTHPSNQSLTTVAPKSIPYLIIQGLWHATWW